jgi:Caspase domain
MGQEGEQMGGEQRMAETEWSDEGESAAATSELTTTGSHATSTRHVGAEPEGYGEPELPTGRKIIVAIGINEYQHQPQLDNPINDAQAVLTLFKQCGFQELPGVPSLVANDATREAIAGLPDRLAAELTPDDNLVVFFAGHGEKIERQAPDPAQPGRTYTHRTGYLIPIDGPKDKPGEWIKLDSFLDDMNGLQARHIFVILDACRSGIALAEKFKVRGGDQPTAVAELQRRPSRRVMTSAAHDEKAAEGGKGSGHSVFVEALIAGIRDRQADKDGDGYIKTVDLFSYVQDQVSERALRLFQLKQTPDYGYLPGDGSGDFVFVLPREKPIIDLRKPGVWVPDQMLISPSAAPAFAVTMAMQFSLASQSKPDDDVPQSWRWAPDLYEKAKQHDESTSEGTWLETLIYCAEHFGVSASGGERVYRAHFYRLSSFDEIPVHLGQGRPIVAAADAYDNWWASGGAVGGMIDLPQGKHLGRISIVLVVYDPNTRVIGFTLSWGVRWGDQGYGYMREEAWRRLLDVNQMWSVHVPMDQVPPSPPVQRARRRAAGRPA